MIYNDREQRDPAYLWRQHLPVHPIADMLPLMSTAELAELAKDIATHGLRNPVTLLRDGEQLWLIDGRNRCDAAAKAGVPVVDAEGRLLVSHEVVEAAHGFDPVAFVMSQNLHRRHLTAQQRRDVTAELLKADPARSDRAVGRLVGASPTTVGTIRQGSGEGRASVQIGR